MIVPRITCCRECADILPLIKEIDCKLYELSLSEYNNIIFSLNRPINKTTTLDLLHYKRILTYKLINEEYACNFSVNMIASKIKKYVIGCRKNCSCEEINLLATTTTTTTTP